MSKGRHPGPPLLAPFNPEEQWLYSKLQAVDRAAHLVSKADVFPGNKAK